MKRSKNSRSTRSALVLLGRFGERGMRQTERRGIAAQLRKARDSKSRIRRARQQRGEQRIFLRARGIDFIDIAGHLVSAVEIRPQHRAIDAGRRLDGDHPFGGNRVSSSKRTAAKYRSDAQAR